MGPQIRPQTRPYVLFRINYLLLSNYSTLYNSSCHQRRYKETNKQRLVLILSSRGKK